MVAAMRVMLLWSLLLVSGCFSVLWAAPRPEEVAVLYNRASTESRRVAEFYQEARGIPVMNLVALDMPVTADITREQYETMIAAPLRAEFDRRRWWKRGRDRAGVVMPAVNRIRVLVTVRDVPLRIKRTPQPKPPAPVEGAPPPPKKNPLEVADEASVDSELAMFGVEGVPAIGPLENKYYNSGKDISGKDFPFLVLTARIDAAGVETCERMVRDAVETEKNGLWGMAYVDVSQKYPMGDKWMETVVRENRRIGIPTVVNRFKDTFPKNYPTGETAALYYGWYDWNLSGPFLHPQFRFRRGAVAMHLHSFSAAQMRDPKKNWSSGLLEKGAAVTIGNVWEPYLHMTHNMGILHQRLLAGDTWVEACWKAMPVVSWQGVVFGDPLYRPFKHLDGTGEIDKEDKAYRALRAAQLQWGKDPVEMERQLGKAADRMRNGLFHEAAGLEMLENGRTAVAMDRFGKAKALYVRVEDKMRQDFHVISQDRKAGRKDLAIRGLRDGQTRYGSIPAAESFQAWLDILDPPPPPPADPTKPQPGAKKKPKPKKPAVKKP